MAATDIKLVRKGASAPDFGRNVTLKYQEKNFPLTNADGSIKYTTELNTQGNSIPEYYEILVNVQIPSPIPSTIALRQAMLDALKVQADDQAKIIAQIRANDIVDKNKIRTIVKTLDGDTGVVFEGTIVIPGV